MSKQLIFKDFTGGLNLADSTTIKDNELARADNCYYDSDNRLRSRKGVNDIFNPISDTVTVIASMNTFDGDGTWSGSNGASNVATDTTNKKYDSGSVSFDIAATSTNATITNTGITSVDLTSVKETGFFRLWINIKDITGLNGIKIELGDTVGADSYYLEDTTSTFTVGWNLLKFSWENMLKTGTPTGAIDEIAITLKTDATYAGGTGFGVDCISWNSETYTNETMSLFHVKLDDNTRVTLASSGTGIFKLENDNDWVLIADGYTSNQRFSFVNYKNVIYFSNGVDDNSNYTNEN